MIVQIWLYGRMNPMKYAMLCRIKSVLKIYTIFKSGKTCQVRKVKEEGLSQIQEIASNAIIAEWRQNSYFQMILKYTLKVVH